MVYYYGWWFQLQSFEQNSSHNKSPDIARSSHVDDKERVRVKWMEESSSSSGSNQKSVKIGGSSGRSPSRASERESERLAKQPHTRLHSHYVLQQWLCAQ